MVIQRRKLACLRACDYTGYHQYDDDRRDAFSQLVQKHGSDCHQFINRTGLRTAKSWEKHQQQLTTWLTKLPKPIGVMCCHDDRGQQVLDACRWADLGVPDEVAVIARALRSSRSQSSAVTTEPGISLLSFASKPG